MFSVFAAHAVDLHDQHCSCNEDDSDADQRRDAYDVHDGIKDEQSNYPSAQIPDILRSQALKLDTSVNTFVDLIYTVCHNCIFIGL